MDENANKAGHKPTWQLREAKARLSEIVRRALAEGPQHVSLRGAPAAVILSDQDYRQITSKRSSIVDHIIAGEPWPDDLVEAINDRRRGPDRPDSQGSPTGGTA